MYLEEFIHQQILTAFTRSAACRESFGQQSLNWVDKEEIEAYQLFRLREMIAYATANSAHYRELKLDALEINSLADIRKIPFTTSEMLSEDPYRLLCSSLQDVARTFSHFTTGTTTGYPKKIFFTYKDAEHIVESMRAIVETVMESARLSPIQRRVLIYLPDNGPPLSMAGLISLGVRSTGGYPRTGDCSSTTAEKIEAIRGFHPNIIMGSAFRIWRMTQEASQDVDLRELEVNVIFITSEYLSRPMRARLEELWGAEVYHHYGMTEPGFAIGVECNQHAGFHFNETDLLFEVIDPESGEVLEPGQEGELVFTSLEREGMPLIRYRTGDVATLIDESCPCGARTLLRISELPRRLELVVTLANGAELYSSIVDEAMYQIDALIDYRLFLRREDSLECQVELLQDDQDVLEEVERQLLSVDPIASAVSEGVLQRPKIIVVERGVLRRGGRSCKRKILDERGN